MGFAVVVSLPFLYLMLRRPLIRRLALRNVVRRPREAVLVIIGGLLGTAIITGAFVVGDTLHRSLDDRALANLGPVDEVVLLPDRDRWLEASERLTATEFEAVDRVAPMALVGAPVASVGSDRRASPQAQLVETDFARAAALGPYAETGIRGPTPAPGHAVASAQLAHRLGVEAGDRVDVFAYGRTLRMRIDRILPQRGVAGFVFAYAAVADNLFVAPGTISELAAAAEASNRTPVPPSWLVVASNQGDAIAGADRSDAALRELLSASRGLRADVIPAKAIAFEAAKANGAGVSQFFNAMGAFGVLAGVLLLVNVIAMLAEERTSELGMMRAVGLRRATFVGAFCAEGWLYSLAAGLLGTAAGVGLGRFMVGLTQNLYEPAGNAFGLDLRFTASAASMQRGFAAGLFISLATVVLTSWRVSRFDVIRAIRDLPDAPVRSRRLWPLLVGATVMLFGLAMGAAASGTGDPLGLVLGPMLALGGLVPVLERSIGRRAAITGCAIVLVAWLAVGIQILGLASEGESLVPLVVQGLGLVTAGVLLVAQQQDRIGGALRRVSRGTTGLAARLGLAYPLARQFRTTLTLAPFTLVVFTLTFITALSGLITSEVDALADTAAGGYDAVIDSSTANPIDLDEIRARDDVAAMAVTPQTVARVTAPGGTTKDRRVSLINRTVFAAEPPDLSDRGRYRTKREAYEAVIRDPDLAIVTEQFMTADDAAGESDASVPRWTVGSSLTIVDPTTGQGHEYTVAAILAGDVTGNGPLIGQEGATERVFTTGLADNRAWVKLRTAPGPWADRVQGRYVENGTSVAVFSEVADDIFEFILQLVNIYRSYLGLGLIVGVAGIGVVMVRAVRERRHQIGLLRSMGFEAKLVGRSFLFEAGFVAVEGVVLGVGLALLTTYTTSKSESIRNIIGSYPDFVVPWWSLTLLIGGVLLAALLTAFGPARSAARIPPSVALRMVD